MVEPLPHFLVAREYCSLEFFDAVIDLLHVLPDENVSNFFDLFSGVVSVLMVHGDVRDKVVFARVGMRDCAFGLRINKANLFINVMAHIRVLVELL